MIVSVLKHCMREIVKSFLEWEIAMWNIKVVEDKDIVENTKVKRNKHVVAVTLKLILGG